MDPSIAIQTLTADDARAWWDLRAEALERDASAFGKSLEEHHELPVAEVAGRFHSGDGDNVYLGAFAEGRLVGMASIIRRDGRKEQHKGDLVGVYVTSEFRGRGVGRAIVGAAIEHAARDPVLEQILLAVTASRVPAVELYRALGFVRYGTEPRALKLGVDYEDEDLMVLVLPAPAARTRR